MTEVSERDLFEFDRDEMITYLEPRKDERFFKRAIVTPRVLMTMIKHSNKGAQQKPNPVEIVGFLYGAARGNDFLVTDAYETDVIGSETSVAMTDEATWKEIQYFRKVGKLGRRDLHIGWYHSHPGLTCFFSQTDVICHRNYTHIVMGSGVGLVIDPINTMSSGKVHLGAFNTFEKNDFETEIPPEVKARYGDAANNYYELGVKLFTTELDRAVISDIIQKSYASSVSCSPLYMNSKHFGDVVQEISKQVNRTMKPEEAHEKACNLNAERKIDIQIQKLKRSIF